MYKEIKQVLQEQATSYLLVAYILITAMMILNV
jgi:hypothetical protein